jgi:oligopeptide transport system substrate-binding protein
VLEAVQQMWREELGIDVAIAIREARVHLAALTEGDYDVAFITAIPDVADSAQLLGDFTTASPENYPQWRDAAFDQAFESARAASDAAARETALLAAERRLLDAAAVAPVYFNTKIWLMSPRVQGWQEDGLWSRCYHQIRLAAP